MDEEENVGVGDVFLDGRGAGFCFGEAEEPVNGDPVACGELQKSFEGWKGGAGEDFADTGLGGVELLGKGSLGETAFELANTGGDKTWIWICRWHRCVLSVSI